MNKPIATTFLLIVSLLVVVLFVVPEYQTSEDLGKELFETKSQYEGQSQYFANISQIIGDLNTRQEALTKIDSALPTGFSVAPIVYFLGEQALNYGLVIQSVELSPNAPIAYNQMVTTDALPAAQEMAFVAHVAGPYKNVKDFISAIESSARVFEITTLSLKPQGVPKTAIINNAQPAYEVTLEIKTHAY